MSHDVSKFLEALPAHACSLHLTHNQHRDYYESAEDYLLESHNASDVTPEDRAECIRTDEIWELQWYPNTPVGFHRVIGPTLARVIERANEP